MQKQAKQNFEILPHKKGACIKARGHTIQELFSHVLEGLALYLYPDLHHAEKSESNIIHTVTVEAVDLNSLLVEFLTEIIGYCDMQNAVFTKATFLKLGENFLEAELTGSAMHKGFEKEIKGISYEEIEVKRNPKTKLYETMLVFEV